MRRASIDRINSRYRGGSAISPAAGVRTSVVRGVSPVGHAVGVSHIAPAVIGGGASVIGGPSVVYGGRAPVVGRGTSVVGGPIYGSTVAPVYSTGGVIRNSTIAHGGLRRSAVIAPPVYETVNHPPVYETVTTPGRVYEIVTPIVEVTPDTVVQTDVVPVKIK